MGNGRTPVTLMTIASQVNAPPRDTIRVGSTDFPDTGTRSLRKQVKEGEFNTVVFTPHLSRGLSWFFHLFQLKAMVGHPGRANFVIFLHWLEPIG